MHISVARLDVGEPPPPPRSTSPFARSLSLMAAGTATRLGYDSQISATGCQARTDTRCTSTTDQTACSRSICESARTVRPDEGTPEARHTGNAPLSAPGHIGTDATDQQPAVVQCRDGRRFPRRVEEGEQLYMGEVGAHAPSDRSRAARCRPLQSRCAAGTRTRSGTGTPAPSWCRCAGTQSWTYSRLSRGERSALRMASPPHLQSR